MLKTFNEKFEQFTDWCEENDFGQLWGATVIGGLLVLIALIIPPLIAIYRLWLWIWGV